MGIVRNNGLARGTTKRYPARCCGDSLHYFLMKFNFINRYDTLYYLSYIVVNIYRIYVVFSMHVERNIISVIDEVACVKS